jgi:hypothetical protein
MTTHPGVFYYLLRDGLVAESAISALLEALPPQGYVQTSARGGEAFDSTQWPLIWDVTLAAIAANRLIKVGDEVLRAATRIRLDHLLALADDGLYAYHVHRRLPGPTGEPSADVIRAAMERELLSEAELLLITRLMLGSASTARVTGAIRCDVVGESFMFPLSNTKGAGGSMRMFAAGDRALVLIAFEEQPPWISSIRAFRNRPLGLLDRALTLVVPDRSLPDDAQAPAAVASLVEFVKVMIEAHLALHPADAEHYPIIDDESLGRMFDSPE